MSVGTKLLQAAAGNAGEAVYVDDLFSTFLYQGTSSNQDIVNGLDLSGEGGLVWVKGRPHAGYSHNLYDTARGVTKRLASNETASESTYANSVTAFNNNGFSLGSDGNGEANYSGSTYVSWSFRKAEKFFDIVTYTGDGNADRQINHNLGSVPGMMIIKKYVGSTTRWAVFHRSIGTGKFLSLDDTAAVTTQSDFWETAPTATQFTVETNGNVNNNGDSYVAYLFAHDEQGYGENSDQAIIKCGIYSGNSAGSATTDQTITLGFEPQWIMIKKALNGIGRWSIFDNMRGVFVDSPDKHLSADINLAEESDDGLRFDATGFTLEGGNWNYTDGTTAHQYIYMAIARPHKPASELAATDLFAVDNRTTTTSPAFISGFPVDMAIHRTVDETGSRQIASRLTGSKVLFTDSSSTESTISSVTFDYMNGHREGASANADEYAWMFRRAKGFFDVVTYTGSSSVQNVAHNLGAVPEMMWIKRRDTFTANWAVYHSAMGNDKALNLNTDKSYLIATDSQFNSTTPTASVFTVGANYSTTNNNGRFYIAYLFASVSGISKVGSYTGTGNDLNVDCGFSAGARFVLIKRWDRVGGSFGSNGDWYVYDSVRGIVAGNDPYLLLNTTDTQVTNTDYIDPLSSGFTVTSSAPDALNASGGTYIFLATA